MKKEIDWKINKLGIIELISTSSIYLTLFLFFNIYIWVNDSLWNRLLPNFIALFIYAILLFTLPSAVTPLFYSIDDDKICYKRIKNKNIYFKDIKKIDLPEKYNITKISPEKGNSIFVSLDHNDIDRLRSIKSKLNISNS